MTSLERRLGTGLLVALLVVFGFLLWGSISAVSSLSESYVSTRLEHDAEALLGAVRIRPDGRWRLREGRVTPIYQQPLSGHYFVVTFVDGKQVRSRSLWDAGLEVAKVSIGEKHFFKTVGPDNQQLLVLSAGYQKDGHRIGVTVAEDLTPLVADQRRFQWLALAVLGALLVVVLLSQRYVLRRSFKVIDAIRSEMSEVAAGKRQQLQTLGPSEVRPLTGEVNRLLMQLQQSLKRSRRALGNLAHALKAPLSLAVHDMEELPLSDADRQRVLGRLDHIRRLIERELKRARFAGEGSGQHFLPSRDLPELLEALRRIHRQRNLQVTHGVLSDTPLHLDYEDMLELLGNLLDNAFKWARSRVDASLRVDGDIVVNVADDGPGVPTAVGEELLQRGTRLDEQESGSGLGLAIVHDLVRHYGGRVALGRSDALGGLRVEVRLPQDRVDPGSA